MYVWPQIITGPVLKLCTYFRLKFHYSLCMDDTIGSLCLNIGHKIKVKGHFLPVIGTRGQARLLNSIT